MSARGELIRLARHFPELIDAKAVRVVGEALLETWEGAEEALGQVREGGKGQTMRDHDQFGFKYLICTHGPATHWSNRFRALLSTGALVLKQHGTLYEFWEYELEPYVHYLPVKADLSDLIQQLQWARDNDDQARTIAQNGPATPILALHMTSTTYTT